MPQHAYLRSTAIIFPGLPISRNIQALQSLMRSKKPAALQSPMIINHFNHFSQNMLSIRSSTAGNATEPSCSSSSQEWLDGHALLAAFLCGEWTEPRPQMIPFWWRISSWHAEPGPYGPRKLPLATAPIQIIQIGRCTILSTHHDTQYLLQLSDLTLWAEFINRLWLMSRLHPSARGRRCPWHSALGAVDYKP